MRFTTVLFLPFVLLAAAVEAATFTCNAATTTPRCQSLIGYVPQNSTTFAGVASLFQSSLRSILAANNLHPSTPSSKSIQANTTIRVPIPCSCSKGTGTSAGVPVYTVKPGDTLDDIARYTFGFFVTYQEIQEASNIPDPNKIVVGQKLTIPLPCSCDQVVPGEDVVHLAHSVAHGSSVDGIAAEFGITAELLMKINKISDPKTLQAGQILDVPLRACSSSINSATVDHDLRVPNGSYALTANDCIFCSCSAPSYQLDCHLTQGLSSSKCRAQTCGKLFIGNTSVAGCQQTTCAYAGFTNTTTGLQILANTTTQNTCSGPPGSQPNPTLTPSGSDAHRLGLPRSDWVVLVIVLHMTLLCLSLL